MSQIKDLLKSTIVNIGYLTAVFFVGVFIIYALNGFLRYNLSSNEGIIATAVIFTLYVAIEMTLLYFKKITPAILGIAIALAPFVIVYKLFTDSDLLNISSDVPSRVARNILYTNFFISHYQSK